MTLQGGAVELTPLRLDFGRGTLTAQGRMDERFDVDVAASTLPLDIANIIQPALALAGSVTGTARVVGPRDAPNVTFDVAATDVASSITRNAGLPPVTLDARGRTDSGRLNLTATVGSGTGLAARAQGWVPLGAGALDLGVELQAFPLAYLDRLAGRRGLRGTVTGRGHAGGPLADPTVTFDLRGEGVTADLLAANTVPPLTIAAAGSYRHPAVQLDTARVSGAGGIDLQGSGRIPFQGPGLDARVSGTAPLALANPFLEDRAAQATGQLRISAAARGSLANPQLSGEVSLQGGGFTDPQTNVRLENISLDARLEGNAAVLRSLRAEVASGGVVSAEGRVSLAARLPGRPLGAARRRALHRRHLRQHPPLRRADDDRPDRRRRRPARRRDQPRPDRDLGRRGPRRQRPGGARAGRPRAHPAAGAADARPGAGGTLARRRADRGRPRHRPRRADPRARTKSSCAAAASTSSSAATSGSRAPRPTCSRSAASSSGAAGW